MARPSDSQATFWVRRIINRRLDEADCENFKAWINEPDNVQAFLTARDQLDLTDAERRALRDAVAQAIPEFTGNETTSNKKLMTGPHAPPLTQAKAKSVPRDLKSAIFCVIAGVLVVGSFIFFSQHPVVDFLPRVLFETHLLDKVYETRIGELRTVVLKDHSSAILNTNTRIRVRIKPDERLVFLERGEARFEVFRDPTRPFVVQAQRLRAQALGTVFNMRRHERATTVTVIEGHVGVDYARGPIAHVFAGDHADVSFAGGAVSVAKSKPNSRAITWTERRLVFDGERLIDAVSELNRYLPQPIEIVDAEIIDIPVNGRVPVESIGALKKFLGQDGRVLVEEVDGTLRLTKAR